MIRLLNVTKIYPGQQQPAIAGLDLEIPRNNVVVLVGPSGCGKTTILKMINRVIEPSSGVIEIDGDNVLGRPAHQLRREIGYVIQRVGLFPHRTIRQNIATVPALLGWDAERIHERTTELMRLMDLPSELLDRYPSALSGGQQQRVGVARALAADPPILLMDEPYGAVDPLVRGRLQQQLLDLQAELHKTIVFVTHDIDEAIMLGDRVVILETGGTIAQYAEPAQILRAPASPFVTKFLGSDRNLRRLSLSAVKEADLVTGPVVDLNDEPAAAHHVAQRERTDWVGVTDAGKLVGWTWVSDIDATGNVSAAQLHAFRVLVHPDDSLRNAVDAIVANRNQVAVVCDDDGSYLGMLFIETISRELFA